MRTPTGLAAPDLRNSISRAADASPAAQLATMLAPSGVGGTHQYGRVVYTVDGLMVMTMKHLKEICRSRELLVSGKKQELMQRILTSQLGPYQRGAAGP
jgi:hypothetical protein